MTVVTPPAAAALDPKSAPAYKSMHIADSQTLAVKCSTKASCKDTLSPLQITINVSRVQHQEFVPAHALLCFGGSICSADAQLAPSQPIVMAANISTFKLRLKLAF